MAAAELPVPAAAAQSPVTEPEAEAPSKAAIADALELFVAVAAGSLDAVRAQLAKGTPSSSTDENGRTAAMVAAELGHIALLETILAEGCALGAKNHLGWSALTFAAFAGQVEALRLLAARGLAVDDRDVSGATPLCWAAAKGHAAAVLALLELGADLSARDVHGRTALAHCAGGNGDAATIQALATAAGCDVNTADVLGRTPLIAAVLANKPHAVDALVRAGADYTLSDAYVAGVVGPPPGPSEASVTGVEPVEVPGSARPGKTALEHAKERKQKHIERYLIALADHPEGSAEFPPVEDQVRIRERMAVKLAKQEEDAANGTSPGTHMTQSELPTNSGMDDNIFTEIKEGMTKEMEALDAGGPTDVDQIEGSLEDLD